MIWPYTKEKEFLLTEYTLTSWSFGDGGTTFSVFGLNEKSKRELRKGYPLTAHYHSITHRDVLSYYYPNKCWKKLIHPCSKEK